MSETILLRSLAALLIANSHIEHFYPIRQLAADGLLGDSLFFLLSGFGLVLSARRTRRPFVDWYRRRVARIYPAILLVTFVFDFLLKSGWTTWTARDYALNFGWGGSYAFVSQIMTFYAVFYWILTYGNEKTYRYLFVGLFLPYVLIPILGRSDALFHAFHWLFYFQVMLFGGWLAARDEELTPGGVRELAAFAGLAAVYVGVRVAVGRGGPGAWFFLPHLLIFPMLYLMLRLARTPGLARALTRRPRLSWLVGLIGGSTLEIYLIHYQVLNKPMISSLVFPLNVAVFLVVSVASARLLSGVVGRLQGIARRGPPALRPLSDQPLANLDGASVTQ